MKCFGAAVNSFFVCISVGLDSQHFGIADDITKSQTATYKQIVLSQNVIYT